MLSGFVLGDKDEAAELNLELLKEQARINCQCNLRCRILPFKKPPKKDPQPTLQKDPVNQTKEHKPAGYHYDLEVFLELAAGMS